MEPLLSAALAAHGGLGRWDATASLVADVRSGGFALTSRGHPRAFARYRATVSTRTPRVEFSPFGGPGRRGVFTPGAVQVVDRDGRVTAERRAPRAAFAGLRRRLWWDTLDVLYFGGYAMWNYLTTPFLLCRAGFAVREIEPWTETGERRRRLHVTFPDDVPTHCREQVFHFDAEGRLRRLDYTAEVFGGWATAAHYCDAHRDFDGLLVPTRRYVLPRARSGLPRPFPTLIWIAIDDVHPVRDT